MKRASPECAGDSPFGAPQGERRSLGIGLFWPPVFGRSGRPEEGLQVLEEGFASSAKTGEQLGSPYLHHVKGELLLIQNPSHVAEAERCFCIAIEIARRQSARSPELLATT